MISFPKRWMRWVWGMKNRPTIRKRYLLFFKKEKSLDAVTPQLYKIGRYLHGFLYSVDLLWQCWAVKIAGTNIHLSWLVQLCTMKDVEATMVSGNGTETGHVIATTVGGRNGKPKQVILLFCLTLLYFLSCRLSANRMLCCS